MNLHLTVLLSYAVILMGVGLWIGRRVNTAGGFFVAGRRLGPFLLFSTMLAANIGAGSTVNAAGLGYRDGLSAWWWVGSAGLGSIVLALWIGPRVRALSEAHGLRTVGDFLEYRYGQRARATVAVLLWIGTLAILAGQLIAIASVLNVITGLDRWVGCIIGGVVVTVYFSAGGLLTSVWVNVLQLGVLLTGFVVVFPLTLSEIGGMGPGHRGDARHRWILELLARWRFRGGSILPCWAQPSSCLPDFSRKCTAHATIRRCGSVSE